MAVPQTESQTPTNHVVCQSVCDGLSSRCYSMGFNRENYLAPMLICTPIHHTKKVPPRLDLTNQASLILIFLEDAIELMSQRPTNTRTIEIFRYEDPRLFERMALTLARFDICLRV